MVVSLVYIIQMCLLHLSITRSRVVQFCCTFKASALDVSLVNSRTLSTRPRPRTIEIVLEDPRGQGHVLEDSITAQHTLPPLYPLNY